ncbi:MAG: hypothetical protein RI900_1907 [Actinomycetota bacterium]|jgi:hypothetical protein
MFTLRRLSAAALAGGALGSLVADSTALAVSSGILYYRQYNMNNNVVVNGCRSTDTVAYGSSLIIGLSNTWTFGGSAGSCSSSKAVPAGYLYSFTYLFANGSLCSSAAATNSASSNLQSTTTNCARVTGYPYYTTGYHGWYKGQNCQPSDYCSNGYSFDGTGLNSPVLTG